MPIFVKRQGPPFTQREIAARPSLLRYLPVSLGIGLVLGYLGPYGSYALPLAERMFFWELTVLAGHILTEGSIRLILHARPHWAWLPVAAGVAVAASPPIALLVWLSWAPVLVKIPLQPLELSFQVLLIEAMITLPLTWWHYRLAFRSAAPPLDSPVQDQSAESPFLRRIPAALGRELLSLTMEDHYLRIHTLLGSDLILMRLRDAVAELEGMGLQVHRSHWVAKDAVVGHEKRDGRIWLLLRNGHAIPVSKTGQSAVRAAGWLKR